MAQEGSFSASIYRKIEFRNKNVEALGDLLDKSASIKGKEVGERSYVQSSDYYFIKNRSLQETDYIPYLSKESPVPIKPQSFIQFHLKQTDILFSKDSNVGECCILESNQYDNFMISSGIIRMRIKKNPYYVFAFLKHLSVKEQLIIRTPKGSTIKHSGERILECKIPFPIGPDAGNIIAHVEGIVKEIIENEVSIRLKDKKIFDLINEELITNQKIPFISRMPTHSDIYSEGRMDAGIYSEFYRRNIFLIKNYSMGCLSLTDRDMNFSIKPGPSLEKLLIGNRIDSDYPLSGKHYTLIVPTNITDYGTVDKMHYIGCSKSIEALTFGDILLGESGTWRSMVVLFERKKCITNAHGHRLRQNDNNIELSVFVRCILSWYKKAGLFDRLAVGGSGGHISPSYFNKILIPLFPDKLKKEIMNLYYSIDGTGISQLDEKNRKLKENLDSVLDRILKDNTGAGA